jgi:hypothetical protein
MAAATAAAPKSFNVSRLFMDNSSLQRISSIVWSQIFRAAH